MTAADIHKGLAAAGAVAFAYESAADTLHLTGDASGLGLKPEAQDWPGFVARLGPADQIRLAAALRGDHLDLRVRLVGDAGRLAWVRLLGRRVDADRFEGLITPAGPSADAAVRIREEHALANAVEAGEVLAWYQPIIDLENGRLAGFEALARWERPDLGVLTPDDFLDMADDIDLLEQISTHVRSRAIADLATWRAAFPHARELFVSANATVSELVDEEFCEALIAEIQAAGLPRGAFKLEIAETEIMEDPDRALAAMTRLAEAGIALALDDFGTGYSSLARLDMLPFNIVKVDRYFVRAMAGNESAGTVVQSVVQLAAHFGMRVVAEGVEGSAVASQLTEMGCHFAQGYRYAGALAPDAAEAAVERGLEGRFNPPG
ncbi:EAL domain-containing protein [Maricaulis sp. CAU 1757]